uniref:Putative secreted protein n=1 Tax=Anopheles marajoara TaxID=58244 RepID=A0A2M4CBX3_9DIPT
MKVFLIFFSLAWCGLRLQRQHWIPPAAPRQRSASRRVISRVFFDWIMRGVGTGHGRPLIEKHLVVSSRCSVRLQKEEK